MASMLELRFVGSQHMNFRKSESGDDACMMHDEANLVAIGLWMQ
jgi:hypothetical protein